MEKITQKTIKEWVNSCLRKSDAVQLEDDAKKFSDIIKFFKDNKDRETVILPCDDPGNGETGFIIFTNDIQEEKSVIYKNRVFNVDRKVSCDFEDFEKYFYNAVDKNYYIIHWQNPKTLKLGFISLAGDESVLYYIRLNELKRNNII